MRNFRRGGGGGGQKYIDFVCPKVIFLIRLNCLTGRQGRIFIVTGSPSINMFNK